MYQRTSILCAATAFFSIILLLGCSGVGTSVDSADPIPPQNPLPPAPPDAKAHSVYAVFPPVTPKDDNYDDFDTYVLAHSDVAGVTVGMPWNQIESDTTPGAYDFARFDDSMQHFFAAGKIVNIIVEPVKEGGVNTFTPDYVLGADWASSCCGSPPVDVVTCNSFEGNGNPGTGMPVVYEAPFQTAYKNFMKAVMEHYNGNAYVPVGYIRFGLVMGGEAAPLCHDQWPLQGAPDFRTAFLNNYVKPMLEYEASLHPAMQILANIHAVGSPVDNGYADMEADWAVENGFGFGNNGLQSSDLPNYAAGAQCNANWCASFIKYVGTTFPNGNGILLELQTLNPTDPTGASETGSLATLLPFAGEHYANTMELRAAELLLAFDPNYNRTAGANVAYAPYASAYAEAIHSYITSK